MANKKYFPGELEGDGFSKLTQVIAQVGYNREMRIEVGEVTKAPPSLEIVLNDGLTLEADDLTLAQHITNYTLKINGNDAVIDNALKVGERVILISDDDTDEYFVIDRAVTYG